MSISSKRSQKITTNASSNCQPTLTQLQREKDVHEVEEVGENDDSKSIDYDLSQSETDNFVTNVNDDQNSLNEQELGSEIGDTECNYNIYIDKVKALSLKVNQQAAIIKQQQIEIKRLRSTSIGNHECDYLP